MRWGLGWAYKRLWWRWGRFGFLASIGFICAVLVDVVVSAVLVLEALLDATGNAHIARYLLKFMLRARQVALDDLHW